ncbi:MAG: hypothetical protein P4L73_20750 [Caulobacteraceae bacterium]|nr:hypothetical protein [Caulobacteraceae bacterium]
MTVDVGFGGPLSPQQAKGYGFEYRVVRSKTRAGLVSLNVDVVGLTGPEARALEAKFLSWLVDDWPNRTDAT